MNLKRENIIFILQICPLLVYGTVTITSTGTQIIGETLVLTCTLSSFTGTASWVQDGTVRTICTSTFCNVNKFGNFTFSYASNHITVTFEHVDSSINGLWECTHSTLGSANVTLTAINETLTTSTTPGSVGTNTSTDNGDGKAIGILTGCLVIAYIIVIVMVAKRLSIESTWETSGNCFLTFCLFIEKKFFDCCGRESSQEVKEKLFDCCGCESSQESEGDPGFFKDKVLTLNSILGFTYLVFDGVIVEVIVLLAVYYGYSKFQEGLVIGVGFVIVLVLSGLCLLVVWMLMKFVNNERLRSQSCGRIRNGTVTPHDRQQPDGDEGIQSTPTEIHARLSTPPRPLPPIPDIASKPQGTLDSLNSHIPIVLPHIENSNIPPSINTLDEQKTDKKPTDKKKKKKKKNKKKKDVVQDNPVDVQGNNVLTSLKGTIKSKDM